MNTFSITEGEVYFPVQCSCGHIIQRYLVKVDEAMVRPFVWCGWCRKRTDLKDRPGKIYEVPKVASASETLQSIGKDEQ